MAIEQRTDAKTFDHFYPVKDIANRKDITIELQINESPCVGTHQVTITIPPEQRDNTNVVFNPGTTRVAFNVATPVVLDTTITRRSTSSASPVTKGNELLAQIAKAMDSPAQLKKLTDGSMNTAIGKEFLEVLTDTQAQLNANRARISAADKTQIMVFYTQVAVGMINYIGMLQGDLKSSEGLAKNFTAAGASMKAMVALGMAAKQKNEIKNRLTALGELNKPVAASLARSINSSL